MKKTLIITGLSALIEFPLFILLLFASSRINISGYTTIGFMVIYFILGEIINMTIIFSITKGSIGSKFLHTFLSLPLHIIFLVTVANIFYFLGLTH